MSVLTLIIATSCTNYFHNFMEWPNQGGSPPAPAGAQVTVEISPNNRSGNVIEVSRGALQNTQFTAHVKDMGNHELWADETVFWSITGGTPNKASIGPSGYLHVPSDEASSAIRVRAVAKANPAMYDEVVVTIVDRVVAYHPALQLSATTFSYSKGDTIGSAPGDPIPPVQITVTNTMDITAQSGTLTYQWYKATGPSVPNPPTSGTLPGGSSSGANSAIFKPDTSVPGTAYYYVVVTNTITTPHTDVATEVSSLVLVTVADVKAVPPAPQLSTYAITYPWNAVVGNTTADPNPPVQVTVANESTTIDAQWQITGGGPLTYQWYKTTSSSVPNPPTSGTTVTGATTDTFKPDTTTAGTVFYYVVVTNTITTPADTAIGVAGPVAVTVTDITSFTVTTAQEWADVITRIKSNGYNSSLRPNGPSGYIITIGGVSDIIVKDPNRYNSAAGDDNAKYTFNGFQGTVTLIGSGTLSLAGGGAGANSTGAIIGAGYKQTVILAGPTFKGMAANNNAAVFFDYGGAAAPEGAIFMQAGEISGNANTAGNGGGVYVNSAGTFTMSGGTISGNSATGNGGGIYVNAGNFVMQNGTTIQGNAASGNGGGVYFNSAGTFTISGGTIGGTVSGNTPGNSAVSGGGVYAANGNLIMSGAAAIKSNTATGSGGGVYIASGVSFSMTGGTIGGDPATEGNDARNGAGVYVASSSSNFTMLGSAAISGNTAVQSGAGVCNYGTFSMSGTAAISNNVGGTGHYGGGGGVYNGATFSMSGSAAISGNSNSCNDGNTGGGGGVYNGSGNFTMSGGTISSNEATGIAYRTGGGGVYINGGTVTMSGGTISGNTAGNYGGGVYVDDSGTLILLRTGRIGGTGGAVGNTAPYGGGVYINNSAATFTMQLGYITNNSAGNSGGGVYNNGGTFNMSGGTIGGNTPATTANTATSGSGGGVYIASGNFAMSGSAAIMGNSANASGGGVDVAASATFTMNNGTISNNRARSSGGGVYTLGIFTMTSGTIGGSDPDSNGNYVDSSGTGGGGVYVGNGTFTMSGNATISSNGKNLTADSTIFGGGVFVTKGIFTMLDGTISNNKASAGGGGVYIGDDGTFDMFGGIIGGTAVYPNGGNETNSDGGGVHIHGSSSQHAYFHMKDGYIKFNTAGSHGGGVYLYGSSSGFILDSPAVKGTGPNGSITDNTGTSGADNLWASAGSSVSGSAGAYGGQPEW